MNRDLFKSILLLIAVSFMLLLSVIRFDYIILGVNKLLSVLNPLFIAIMMAYILRLFQKKIYNYFEIISKRISKKNRPLFNSDKKAKNVIIKPLSIVMTYALFIGFTIALISFIIPEVNSSFAKLYSNLGIYGENLTRYFEFIDQKMTLFNIDTNNIKNMVQSLPSKITTYISEALPNIYGFTLGVFGSIMNVVLGFILSVYLVAGSDEIDEKISEILDVIVTKEKKKKILYNIEVVNDVFSAFVIGQFTEAIILATLCFAGMIIFKFDYAPLISCIIGVLSLLPLIGGFMGAVISAFLLLMISPAQAFWFIVFFVVLQQLEGNLIYPRVVGNSLGLPAIWVMIAIIVGGGLFGVLGITLGIPLFAIVYRLFKEYLSSKKTLKKAR